MHGQECMFRHEHRLMKQVHRRHYSPHLCVLEYLFKTRASETEKTAFMKKYVPETGRLSIFREIEEENTEIETPDEPVSDLSKGKLEIWSIGK